LKRVYASGEHLIVERDDFWCGKRFLASITKGNGMLNIQDFVKARLYDNEEDVIQDALRHLLRGRPDLRIQLAIYRYQTEEISLAKAANVAGVSWAQMKEVLLERGIQPRLGPSTIAEAETEIQALRDHFKAQP
jgi:predicted HTH domain antitoxin